MEYDFDFKRGGEMHRKAAEAVVLKRQAEMVEDEMQKVVAFDCYTTNPFQFARDFLAKYPNQKIQAIKAVRSAFGMGLLDAKNTADMVMNVNEPRRISASEAIRHILESGYVTNIGDRQMVAGYLRLIESDGR